MWGGGGGERGGGVSLGKGRDDYRGGLGRRGDREKGNPIKGKTGTKGEGI